MGLGAAGTAAAIGAAGAAASAGGSIISSSNAAGAANTASQQQQASTAAALAQQQQQLANTQTIEAPYFENGDNAQSIENFNVGQYGTQVTPYLNQLTSLGNSATAQQALAQTPGYQFTLNQGLQSTQNAAAARGLGVSGAALKGAATYATGLADNTYQQQYSNASNNLTQAQNTWSGLNNALTGMASLGENAAVGAGNQGQAAVTNSGNLLTSSGNAQAASTIAQANATTNGITGATNSLSQAANNPLIQNYLAGLSGNGSQYGSDGAPQTPQSGYANAITSIGG